MEKEKELTEFFQEQFEQTIVEKINFVCSKKCWRDNIGSFLEILNGSLRDAKKLGLHKGKDIDEILDSMKALHEIEFFGTMRKVILNETGLRHLFEPKN